MKDIGQKLKEARETIGLSLEETANDLKVEDSQIADIENGNLKAFDDIVTLKYFIRDYAKYLGLDYDDIVDEYNEYLFDSTSKISLADIKEAKRRIEKKENKEKEKIVRSPYTIIRKDRTKQKVILWSLLFFLLFLLVSYLILQLLFTQSSPVENVIR